MDLWNTKCDISPVLINMPDYKQLIKKKEFSKNSPKKNRRETKRPRKFLSKAGLSLLLGALTLSSYFVARHFLLHFSGFKISKVSVADADGKPLRNPEGIFRLDTDYNLFDFDMQRAAQDIRARHPELAGISIRKQFPDKLLIVVKERKPVALIVSSPDLSLVDEEGFILPFKPAYRHLPKIIGIHHKQIQPFAKSRSLRLHKALDLLKELEKAKVCPEYKVSKIDVKEYSNIVFYFENRIEVKMGQNGFERKAALLDKILTQLKTTDTVPKYIDMRFDSPAVKP